MIPEVGAMHPHGRGVLLRGRRVARWFFLAAAGCALLGTALPLWECTFRAPQYAGEPLHVRLRATGLTGDLDELDRLDQYIGVSIPRHLPELRLLGPLLWALAAVLAASAALRGNAGRWVRRGSAALFVCALAGALAYGQLELYDIGHHRSAHSPIRLFPDFTPLLIGPTRVGNFHVLALPGPGGWLLALAAILVGAALLGERPRLRGGSHAVH